jgi:Glycosyl transferase family 2
MRLDEPRRLADRTALTMHWTGLLVLGWTYVLFPTVLAVRAWLRPRLVRSAATTPRVSLLCAAHNEAGVIVEKIENCLALDYPPDRLQIIIASDGSTDGTVPLAEPYADEDRIQLLSLPRVGKATALNAAIDQAYGDVLVFTDANSLLQRDALRHIVAPLADHSVGGVAGNQRYLGDPRSGTIGERKYWDVERVMKRWQTRAGSATSATGALYAVRRSLVEPVPVGVTDDFWTSTGVIARGHRLVFEQRAVAWEPVSTDERKEFDRKLRVMTRGLTAIGRRPQLLDPRQHGFYAIQLLTHKVLRRLTALPLSMLLVSSLWLRRRNPWHRTAAYGLTGALAIGVVGWRWPGGRRPPRIASVFTYALGSQLIGLRAGLAALRGNSPGSWVTVRDEETSSVHAIPKA